jgi:alkylated DNA repair dioxygenase AlkB
MNRKMPTQPDLFNTDERLQIPGATYVLHFVTPEEESEIIRQIEQGAWSREFARRRQHYGIAYDKPDWKNPTPLPGWIENIGKRIVAAGLFSKMPVQALVNEYEPGQGISAHKDYEPFDEVASLSLVSGCLMELVHTRTKNSATLWLEPCSLLVLTGEARHEWTHAIRPRLNDMVAGVKIARQRRLSLTLRTIARQK